MLNMYVFNTSIIVWIAINRYEWVLAMQEKIHIIKLYNAGLNTGASPDLHKYWHIATQPQQSV